MTRLAIKQFSHKEQSTVIKSWKTSLIVHKLVPLNKQMNKALDNASSDVIEKYMQTMMIYPLANHLSLISIPVFIFMGTKDSLIPNKMFRKEPPYDYIKHQVEDIPNYHCIPLYEMDHWPHIENSEELITIMKKYLMISRS